MNQKQIDDGLWQSQLRKLTDLESRLAASEKRAEDAEAREKNVKAACFQAQCAALEINEKLTKAEAKVKSLTGAAHRLIRWIEPLSSDVADKAEAEMAALLESPASTQLFENIEDVPGGQGPDPLHVDADMQRKEAKPIHGGQGPANKPRECFVRFNPSGTMDAYASPGKGFVHMREVLKVEQSGPPEALDLLQELFVKGISFSRHEKIKAFLKLNGRA